MTDEKTLDGAAHRPNGQATAPAPEPAGGDVASKDVASKDAASDNGKEEIFHFPCDFPIKVMGKAHPDFAATIMDVVEELAPDLDRSRVEVRPSSGGNYTGLTVNINAQSRAQLDRIYLALTGHPMVKVVL